MKMMLTNRSLVSQDKATHHLKLLGAK